MQRKGFKELAGFDDRYLIFIGYPIASLLITMLIFSQQLAGGNLKVLSVCLPLSFIYTGIFWFLLRHVYMIMLRHYPETSQIRIRLMLLAPVFLIIYSIVNIGLDYFFRDVLNMRGHEENPILEFTGSLLMAALVMTLYEAISFYVKLQKTVAEKEQLQRQNVESQLEGLRNQVNPHFLFNSLNTLTWLIPENSDKAVRFVQQLSKVYRYVLESRDAKIVSMREELEFLKSYTYLLYERFGNNLEVRITDIPDSTHCCIVPLSLQMLFENAIKHNIISQEKKLVIEVFTEQNKLVIRNNIQRKNQVMDSTGVGLENIQNRYLLLTGKTVEIVISQQYFTVILPMIHVGPPN
jgi:two-component system, LytTR family, sensor kinase